ncbi:MAG: isoprenylcysteine carboxylmethyltransferase family protein [Terriglobales bacterium]
MIWRYLIEGPWIVLILYWWISALKANRAVLREPFLSRYGILFLILAGYFLVFSNSDNSEFEAKFGPLGHQIFNTTEASLVMAVALTWIGLGIALWARWHLGQYWSARVTVKEGHQLIRTGPYKYFRHPIYSGFDLAVLGGVLAVDRWRCVVGLAFVVAAYWIKAGIEESMLSQQFGPAFEDHCRQTGFLLPKF